MGDNDARQMIDSSTIFEDCRRVAVLARKFAGGMYWKHRQDYEYLVKTLPDNRQHRMGRRTPENQRIYEKTSSRTRLKWRGVFGT